MYGKSGVRGSDSGYCEIQNENRHSNTDYLIYPPSSTGVGPKTRLELSDSDRLRCSPRRLSTDLITPQMSVRSEHVDNSSTDSSRSRVTGSSCQALRHAVAALNRLDDFTSEKIGSGFFSEVFKVTHRTTGQVMVLKMNLHRSNRPNMLKEVQLMNQLSHPNILGFMGVCVHEGQLHALTEFINGGSLEQLILNSSLELSHQTRIKLALDIAKGMEYLHSRGVFHRDLTSKNVLIKKGEKAGDMTAVVGDFGLAAKIPDPSDGYRLATVGSPYWMSPECLKGQWYDEKSDVFSYGIVLCELIARCEADPDILPRTENFGLDYLAFADMCAPCPPHFLELAFRCCNFEPKMRPSFSEIVKQLEVIAADREAEPRSPTAADQLAKSGEDEAKVAPAASILGAKSEEVLPQLSHGASTASHKKLSHKRSLSEEMGGIVFPPHTAPSDKARCHILVPRLTARNVGETVSRQDPHYIPNCRGGDKANPFAALAHIRGVKKILGVPSKGLSPSAYVQGGCGGADLFSSCFELPSPFLGLLAPEGAPPDRPKEAEVPGDDVLCEGGPKKGGKSEADAVHRVPETTPPEVGGTESPGPRASPGPRRTGEPLSLPGSPTLMRRRLLALAPAPELRAEAGPAPVPPLFGHPLFGAAGGAAGALPPGGARRACSSTLDLAEAGLLGPEDPLGLGLAVLGRRGSCESGFFSSVGEDFGPTPGDLLSPEFGGMRQARARVHHTSSATLSSSSAASSLFLLDDSAVSTTVGSGELADVEPARAHHSLLFPSKRSSSVYTDSSEDVSSLGDPYWEELGRPTPPPPHISKIVEYFERKHGAPPRCRPAPAPCPAELARRLETDAHLARSSKIAHLRRALERVGGAALVAPAPAPGHGVVRRTVNATQRLMICEGAVKSKLPLFDKK